MKRFAAIILTVTLLFLFAFNTFAQSQGVSVGTSHIKKVEHQEKGEVEEVLIYLGSYRSLSTMTLANPDRIVIDFSDANAPERQQVINTKSPLIKSIRYAQFRPGIARVVLDTVGKLKFKVIENTDHIRVLVSKTGRFPEERREPVSRGETERQIITLPAGFNLEHVAGPRGDEVTITTDNYKNYNAFTLLDPYRIVIDIPNTTVSAKQQTINVTSDIIKSIRYAQHTANMARIVLDMKGNYEFEILEEPGKLIIRIEDPAYENYMLSSGKLTYYNKGDRVYVTLDGIDLTEGGQDLKKLYTDSYDRDNKKYTITFSDELGNLENCILEINDNVLKSIEVLKDESSGITNIVFNAKDDFSYLPIARADVNNTVISILSPVKKSDKLVVIDAGHGGSDPGATYSGLLEKDLNLDIAKRLNKLLEDRGIKTYMIREDDTFVGLYERAYIANNLNASLFLSIHNNAISNPSVSGTMTLCYKRSSGNGFNGYEFASIVQRHLVKTLGTVDRKVIERPNLVVLKATKMPAALAEIAFMTNEEDRNNLKQDSFRQKAAEALANAIIESLTMLD